MPLERTWNGDNLKSNWDKGRPARSFRVHIAVDPSYEHKPNANPVVSLQEKHGVAYGNERFKIKNGSVNFAKSTIKFDMISNEGHVAKVFKGDLVLDKAGHDYVAIHGTIKVHPIWLSGQSQEVYSAYKDYKATVTLR